MITWTTDEWNEFDGISRRLFNHPNNVCRQAAHDLGTFITKHGADKVDAMRRELRPFSEDA